MILLCFWGPKQVLGSCQLANSQAGQSFLGGAPWLDLYFRERVIKEKVINNKASTQCSWTNPLTSSARTTPPSSQRARPKSTPNITRRTHRDRPSRARSSTIQSKSSTGTSPSSPCKASSTGSEKRVTFVWTRAGQVRGCHHRRCPFRQRAQDHQVPQGAGGSEDSCGQWYTTGCPQTHER